MAVSRPENTILRVCIDNAANGRMSGRVAGHLLAAPLHFTDLGSLVLQVDQILDAWNFPQAFQRSRSFTSKGVARSELAALSGSGMSAQSLEEFSGKLATFNIVVFSRRSSSWQGIIDWMDGSPRQPFSSVLQLLRSVEERLSSLAVE